MYFKQSAVILMTNRNSTAHSDKASWLSGYSACLVNRRSRVRFPLKPALTPLPFWRLGVLFNGLAFYSQLKMINYYVVGTNRIQHLY